MPDATDAAVKWGALQCALRHGNYEQREYAHTADVACRTGLCLYLCSVKSHGITVHCGLFDSFLKW
ncbi:hypothetical protein UNDKW_4194 [Undibacterium sp. KW1]|nr:hypothetical protein UNDKW_4194 [Undibacterium sp. KW1]